MRTKGKSPKQTTHRTAAKKPEVKALIQRMHQSWLRLGPQDRATGLKSLIALGCSLRGLASDLEAPESTLRRYLAHPSPVHPSGNVLALEVRTREARTRKAEPTGIQEASENRNPPVSALEKLTEIILDFVQAKYGIPETSLPVCDIVMVLGEVRRYLEGLMPCPPPAKVQLDITNKDLFSITRPPYSGDDVGDLIAHRAKWLTTALISMSRNKAILESALEQAESPTAKTAMPMTPSPYIAPRSGLESPTTISRLEGTNKSEPKKGFGNSFRIAIPPFRRR